MEKKKLPAVKEAQKWADALRSKKFKQGKHKLESEEGFCCLGVACKVFTPEHLQTKSNNKLLGVMPYYQQYAPEWLKNGVLNDFDAKIGQHFPKLNDDLDYTFDEIADLIELVYVHKAIV